jgi:hypothetical protein
MVVSVMDAPKKTRDAKLPYTPPKLRRLGSVRELTFGSSGRRTDAGTTRQP